MRRQPRITRPTITKQPVHQISGQRGTYNKDRIIQRTRGNVSCSTSSNTQLWNPVKQLNGTSYEWHQTGLELHERQTEIYSYYDNVNEEGRRWWELCCMGEKTIVMGSALFECASHVLCGMSQIRTEGSLFAGQGINIPRPLHDHGWVR